MVFKNSYALSLMLASILMTACKSSQPEEAAEPTASDEAVVAEDTSYTDTTATDSVATDTASQNAFEAVTVYFAFDSSELSGEARSALDTVPSGGSIQITGHTDEIGTEEYNDALGMRRAASVKDYLVGRGFSADQITTYSQGKRQPVIPNARGSAQHAKNRRAIVEGTGGGGMSPMPASESTTSTTEVQTDTSTMVEPSQEVVSSESEASTGVEESSSAGTESEYEEVAE